MVSRKDLAWQGRRIRGTAKVLFHNRMAVVGIVLLSSFLFMALGAPLLTPYTPNSIVAGSYAQPDWVMSFPDGYYLSRNLVVSPSGMVTSPTTVQYWALEANTQTISSIAVSYAPGVTSNPGARGSIQVAYSGSTPTTVNLTRTFEYPYRGAPRNFRSDLSLLANGASVSQPVGTRMFIRGPSGLEWTVYNANQTTGFWSTGTFDSRTPQVASLVIGNCTQCDFTAAEVVFSSVGTYTFGLQLTFNGPARVNVDQLQLTLLGTAWGLMGTDAGGADVFTLFVYGARISLLVGLLSATIGISLGLVVGLLAGFLGKFVDEVLMRFTDMLLVIPTLPLLIVLVAVLGANIWNLIIVIGFLGWMGFARIIRSQVLSLRERPFIEAAKASGAGPGRIITRHIFPNIVSLTYVNLALTVPGAILAESALAFLGLSDPNVISWGHMFNTIEVQGAISIKPPPWWWVLPPGLGIALISLSFVLIGYALDELFNPRLRRRR